MTHANPTTDTFENFESLRLRQVVVLHEKCDNLAVGHSLTDERMCVFYHDRSGLTESKSLERKTNTTDGVGKVVLLKLCLNLLFLILRISNHDLNLFARPILAEPFRNVLFESLFDLRIVVTEPLNDFLTLGNNLINRRHVTTTRSATTLLLHLS